MTDAANSTYDYRKIADEKNYHLFNLNSSNSVRFEVEIINNIAAGVQVGAIIYKRKERNSKYDYHVDNLNVTPNIKADIHLHSPNGRHELSLAFQYSRQISVGNEYDVEIQNNNIPHVDFQTCFAPFAYYSSEFDAALGQAVYVHHFSKFSLGARFDCFAVSGSRLADVEYSKNIGFNSVCPMISVSSDKHDEKWFGVSTFILF